MRTGVLSDKQAYRHVPLTVAQNSMLYAPLHFDKHHEKRGRAHREPEVSVHPRGISPMYTNADLAQLLGGKFEMHMDAFGDRLDNHLLQQRDQSFIETVEKFKAKYENVQGGVFTDNLGDDVMWLFETLNINPAHFTGKDHQTSIDIHGKKANSGVQVSGMVGTARDFAEPIINRGSTSKTGQSGTLAKSSARAQRNYEVNEALQRLSFLHSKMAAPASAAQPTPPTPSKLAT